MVLLLVLFLSECKLCLCVLKCVLLKFCRYQWLHLQLQGVLKIIPKATSFVGLTHDLASTSVRCLCRFPEIAIVSDLIRVPFRVKINACWAENLSSSSLFQYLFADALRFSQTRFYCSLATVVAVDTFVHLSGSEYQLFKPRLVRISIASCRGSIFPTFIYVATSIHICYLALHICRCMPIHVSNLVVVFLCCRVWCCVVVC